MSGFLSRVAARAVGEAPLARPKLPARFEGMPSEGGLEIVDTEVHASPPARADSREAAPQPARAPDAPASEPRPIAATARRREPAPAAPMPPAAPAIAPHPAEHVAAIVSSDLEGSTRRFIEAQSEAAPAPVPPAATTTAAVSVTTTVRAAAAVPVTPPVLALRAPARPQPAVSNRATEPPAVRVHIGRLEVRANLQEAPPQRSSRRAETAPPGPSLSDYLRGRRTAR